MKKTLYSLLFLLFLGIFSISVWKVGSYFTGSAQQKEKFDTLSQLHDSVTTVPTTATEPLIQETEVPESTAPTQPGILPELESLHALNSDLVGWLSIPDTVIDYPVMQTPDQPDFYLNRDFDGEYSIQGCLYAEEECDIAAPSDNVTIYGHCMQDRSMFAELDGYLKQEFWETHDTIRFDSLTERRSYKIFAVFKTTASMGQGFAYHTLVDAAHPEEFNSFIYQCKALAFYDTGITPEYGDKIICLSTCEYTQDNGRLVVAAVLEKS